MAGNGAEDRKKHASLWARLDLAARIIGWAFIVGFFGSILWVVVYRFAAPPGTLVMLERSLEGEKVNHAWTPLEEISPNLVLAVIAAEDSRFCQHAGIDLNAIEEAVYENKHGKRRRGASTISQQTAKNAFLWNGGGWARKGAEAWFTLVMEILWPKRRIIEVYLNIAEWGDGHFGAEAAARARFKKSAKDLTKGEAALLAAVLPSPNRWRVDPPGPYVRGRAAMLRKRMDRVRLDGLASCVID
ncbi:MAG: monofunctional biosynthetic peptidoglycan transglycosylase [Parvularculaceae bacterium]